MGCLSYAYPLRILCCLKRLFERDEREKNLNKKHFFERWIAPGTRTPRPRMVWNKPHNKAVSCKAYALTAGEAPASPARAIDGN